MNTRPFQGKLAPAAAQMPVPPTALSVALLVCSALWLAAAWVYHATSAGRPDFSTTPAPWLLTVAVAPAVCFTLRGLVTATRPRAQRTPLDRWALAAALAPVTLGTLLSLWVVKVSLSMIGA